MEISANTLGEKIDKGYRLRAYCGHRPRCGHSAELDLPALAGRLGRNFVADHWTLTDRMRCTVCGRRGGASFTLSPPGPQGTGRAHSMSR
jgi:hypothetical protein